MKRDKRQMRETDQSGGQVATAEDLEGYGFVEPEAPSDRRRPEPR